MRPWSISTPKGVIVSGVRLLIWHNIIGNWLYSDAAVSPYPPSSLPHLCESPAWANNDDDAAFQASHSHFPLPVRFFAINSTIILLGTSPSRSSSLLRRPHSPHSLMSIKIIMCSCCRTAKLLLLLLKFGISYSFPYAWIFRSLSDPLGGNASQAGFSSGGSRAKPTLGFPFPHLSSHSLPHVAPSSPLQVELFSIIPWTD